MTNTENTLDYYCVGLARWISVSDGTCPHPKTVLILSHNGKYVCNHCGAEVGGPLND